MSLRPGSIRGISFDYGHVLGGIDLDELAARLVTIARDLGRDAPRVNRPALDAAMPPAYAAHDDAIARGLHHEGGWRALVGTLVAAALESRDAVESPALSPFVDALWAAQPTRNLWRHVPAEARAMLAALRAEGVPMVVTSNSEGRVAELLIEVGIRDCFTHVFDSGLLGYGKPDRRIFDDAVRALGVPRESVVHIGDSEAADVIGALDAGLCAVRYDGFVPTAAGRPTAGAAAFRTHRELTEALLVAIRSS